MIKRSSWPFFLSAHSQPKPCLGIIGTGRGIYLSFYVAAIAMMGISLQARCAFAALDRTLEKRDKQ